MSRVILLGPQRFEPITREAIESLDLPAGPLALVTAGWEEREDEDAELVEHLGCETVNLKLHARFERALRNDGDLQQALKDVHERLRSQQALYRLRLAATLSATRELFAHAGPEELLEPEREDAVRALAALDSHHHGRVQSIHQDFEEGWQLEAHEELSRAREEVERDLEPCQALLIAGGHVVMLLDRLRAFGLRERIGGRPVVAWSAGAMAVCDQVVTFHDSPPQGRGNPEVLEDGLGLVPGVVALPDARRRLRLDDPVRVSLFARRFAPARCIALDPRSRVDWNGKELRPIGETRELVASGRVEAVAS